MINREGINKAIEAIRELDIRTTSLKDEKIKLIESKADKIMKKHSALLEKAKKYEQRKNEIPLTPKEEKSGFMGLITKAIDKGSSLIDEYQEKSEKEAWEFITANGMRSIKDVEDNQ